jgi:hypothetical protein
VFLRLKESVFGVLLSSLINGITIIKVESFCQ